MSGYINNPDRRGLKKKSSFDGRQYDHRRGSKHENISCPRCNARVVVVTNAKHLYCKQCHHTWNNE